MNYVFFTDRDLGNQFPDILAAAGLTVERHRDHFGPEAPDEEWLRFVGKHGWVAVTHNRRIRYTPNQLQAVMDNSVALLVVVGHAKYSELARAFVATYPRIEAFLAGRRPPFIGKVYRPTPKETEEYLLSAAGRVELWYPP